MAVWHQRLFNHLSIIVFTLEMAQTWRMPSKWAKWRNHDTPLMNLQMFRIPRPLAELEWFFGIVLLMMRSKVPEYRTIGKICSLLIPGICSINEPVIFGLPIVFNPILAIPFLVTPIISLLLTYFCSESWMDRYWLFIVDPSFTPFFAQAYLSSMDWRNILFCLLLIVISIFIYYPFFKVMENNKTKLVDQNL